MTMPSTNFADIPAPTQALRVGFVGLGDMGGAIAGRIIDAGFPVMLWARRETAFDQFAAGSFRRAADLYELGRACDVVGVCVFGDCDVRDILLGKHGVLAGMSPGSAVLIHSTISAQICVELADMAAPRNIAVLDAPVSGQREEALRGELVIMVGGDAAAVERALPVMQAYSDSVCLMGPAGSGQTMKLLNNVLAFAIGSISISAIETAQRLGLEPRAAMEVLCAGGARSMALASMVEKMLPDPDFCRHARDLMKKDTELFSDTRRKAGLPRTTLEDLAFERVVHIVPNLTVGGHMS